MAELANSGGVEIFKIVTKSIAALSVTSVTRKIINNNVYDKNEIRVKIATLVVGYIVFDYVWKNTDAKLDALVEGWNSVGKKKDEE